MTDNMAVQSNTLVFKSLRVVKLDRNRTLTYLNTTKVNKLLSSNYFRIKGLANLLIELTVVKEVYGIACRDIQP